MDLLDDKWFLYQDGVDELDQLVLKREAFLSKLALEDSSVVNIEGLLAFKAFIFHMSVDLLVSCFLVALVGLTIVPFLFHLAEAQYLNQQLDEQTFDVPARDYGVSQLCRILVDLKVRPVRPHD